MLCQEVIQHGDQVEGTLALAQAAGQLAGGIDRQTVGKAAAVFRMGVVIHALLGQDDGLLALREPDRGAVDTHGAVGGGDGHGEIVQAHQHIAVFVELVQDPGELVGGDVPGGIAAATIRVGGGRLEGCHQRPEGQVRDLRKIIPDHQRSQGTQAPNQQQISKCLTAGENHDGQQQRIDGAKMQRQILQRRVPLHQIEDDRGDAGEGQNAQYDRLNHH